jgi:NAD-dependent dihydropyrimidine dehydrogenase PreA subunit
MNLIAIETPTYIAGISTIELDPALCNGCQQCLMVCPHAVFGIADKRAFLRDRDRCMECGACLLNCSEGALSVHPGVGCAAAILKGWLTRSEPGCCC